MIPFTPSLHTQLATAGERWMLALPVPVEFGAGSLDRVIHHLHGARKALVVTGRHAMKEAGVTDYLCGLIVKAGVVVRVFDDLSAEPTYQEITEAAQTAREFGAQVIIGCGGGSAIDGAKAIAVAATHQGSIMDHIVNGERPITAATLPIIAISSTSGTGSHVGRVAVLSDRERKIKRALISDHLFPRAAICDPLILKTMTPEITAVTGFDAFAQALEGFLSRNENPMGNLCAQQAMAIIFPTLSQVIHNGNDLDLRAAMAWGDTLAGVSLATNSIITPHAFSMVLGARYGIPHGRAIAAVMPACLRHSRAGAVHKLAHVARLLGCTQQASDGELADWAIVAIDEFIARINLNRGVQQYGVLDRDFGPLAEEARATFSLRLAADPVPADAEGLVLILHNSLNLRNKDKGDAAPNVCAGHTQNQQSYERD